MKPVDLKQRVKKKRRKTKKKVSFFGHLKSLGFTNRLAIYILLFLAAGLAGGFYLAMRSISTGYMGSLMCWSIVFTPIGTATSIAISRVVDKSKAENVGGNGNGIKYEMAMMQNMMQNNMEHEQEREGGSWESPMI